MTIKLVVFDLDGVLISSKDMHWQALNSALEEQGDQYVINYADHIKKFDGLPTRRKLQLLTDERGLPVSEHDTVWKRKQELTAEIISDTTVPDPKFIRLFARLKHEGYQVYVGSNSIRQTVKMYMIRLGLMEYLDHYVSNEDVCQPKPHPNMYLTCMVHACSAPQETLVVEDSHAGLAAAFSSGAHVCRVLNPEDTTEEKIFQAIHQAEERTMSNKWVDDRLNVLIPMAGAGSRFEKAGYTFPKPLIDVRGHPMIQAVVENLDMQAQFIFIVQQDHYDKYNLQHMLNLIAPGCKIVQVNGMTEGAACTTLLADLFIDNDQPLLLANSDQFVNWNSTEFMYCMQAGATDGGILTFENTHPKWSYAKLDDEGYVTKVAEKNPISTHATVGVYFWAKGSDYVKYARQMIEKNIRVNGEFYVCPVFNEAIADGLKIKTWDVQGMWGLGTPEDLRYFLENHKNAKS